MKTLVPSHGTGHAGACVFILSCLGGTRPVVWRRGEFVEYEAPANTVVTLVLQPR